MYIIFPHSDYKEYHTDTTVRFVVNLSTAKMEEAEKVGFHKKFKMEGSINTSNMVRSVRTFITFIMAIIPIIPPMYIWYFGKNTLHFNREASRVVLKGLCRELVYEQ